MALTNEDWLKAQCSVLGSALIEPKVVRKVMVETASTDYSGACRTVYDAMHQVYLSGKPVDPVSVGAVLGPEHREFLVRLMDVTPTAANIDHYITLCREQELPILCFALDRLEEAVECENVGTLIDSRA